jgi:pimeloyl-ACP methyl ester carboxylesterase
VQSPLRGRRIRIWLAHFIWCAAYFLLAGCAPQITNPSFSVTHAQARADIAQMQQDPKPLDRPVVIIGGFLDPNFSSQEVNLLRSVSRDPAIVKVSLFTCCSFDSCRRRIIDEVDKALPSTDPEWTAEVDVIGNSLGGLAARYAAAPSNDPAHPRRLRIARLFTISSPLRGARLAQFIALTQFHRDMIPGSPFLQSLARSDAFSTYTTVSYVHLDDNTVGSENAALPGSRAYWLTDAFWVPPHLGAMFDPRILADIARRLRDEDPLTGVPPATLPAK